MTDELNNSLGRLASRDTSPIEFSTENGTSTAVRFNEDALLVEPSASI